MAKDIREIIRDFVSFNIEENYYQDDNKAKLPSHLNEILFEDDEVVRSFLQKFFEQTRLLAKEYGLLPESEEDVIDVTGEEKTEY